ncbi:MAG: NAD(P)/FAD-dependent oxidoreductase [Bacillota bacterium]|nr:NAD(P)/FAD-dependent oxidoreductase [Bacillota bacterium]
MRKDRYDLAVVGGGAAGLVAGVAAGAVGARTALVEKDDRLGGECSWTGCVPSKAFLHLSSLAHECGCNPEGNVFDKVRATVQEASRASKAKGLLDRYGVRIYHGKPSFKDNQTLILDDSTVISAKKFILCTGSSARIPEIDGLSEGYLTNQEVWDLPDLPESLLIIGGGPIGTELAQAFHRLGTKVTLFQSRDRVLPRDDEELARELTEMLINEGVDIRLNSKINKVIKLDQGWTVETGEDKLYGQHLLIALGRQANTEGLNLEAAGVGHKKDGIIVNKYLRTTAGNIWAAGDCIGGLRFSHIAEIEAKGAVRNALFPFKSSVNYQGSPWATFTDPELAHLGLTEEECREHSYRYRVYYHTFAGDDRAITDGVARGKVKIITSPYGKILGVHILGSRAGELINEFILARRKGLRLHEIGLTVHVYPTLGMAVQRATDNWFSEISEKPLFKNLIKLARRLR